MKILYVSVVLFCIHLYITGQGPIQYTVWYKHHPSSATYFGTFEKKGDHLFARNLQHDVGERTVVIYDTVDEDFYYSQQDCRCVTSFKYPQKSFVHNESLGEHNRIYYTQGEGLYRELIFMTLEDLIFHIDESYSVVKKRVQFSC